MNGERHPRLVLHDAIQAAMRAEEMTLGLTDVYVTRWALVSELAMTDDRTGLVIVTSTASGAELTSWDQIGLFGKALGRALQRPD